jgi:hypothetical protein
MLTYFTIDPLRQFDKAVETPLGPIAVTSTVGGWGAWSPRSGTVGRSASPSSNGSKRRGGLWHHGSA